MNNFNDELNNFKVHLPGGGELSVADEAAVSKFFYSQNPDWSTGGHVASIPIARVPRVFLQNSEMTKNFEHRYSSLQTGESGEILIYKKLMSLKNVDQIGGTLIFPNVDGNHFTSSDAKVEIDFVVIDSRKGVFVLNVKNSMQIKEMNLVKDMEKHTKFIRLIRDFGQCNATVPPVYGVICSLKSEVDVHKLRRDGYWKRIDSHEQRFVFQPDDVKNFQSSWKIMLEKVPNVDQKQAINLSKLASRLAVLNTMEGSLSFLHEKFESNTIQEVKLKTSETMKVFGQTVSDTADGQKVVDIDEVSAHMQQLLTTSESSHCKQINKKSVILWTNEQLKVICRIHAELKQHKETAKGCRILVAGPKGSGKTMLLLYVAELSKLVLAPNKNSRELKIVVCDGRLGSTQILFEKLKKQSCNRDIHVHSNLLSSESALKNFDLILVDEYIHSFGSDHISKFLHSQHVIIFTSDKSIISSKKPVLPNFEILHLSSSLRSSVELAYFAEDFRKMDTENRLMCLRAGHNYRGPEPVVKILKLDSTEDPEQTRFVDEAFNSIKQVVLESRGLKSILVVPFVHPITLSRILSQMENSNIQYEYRNPEDFLSKSRQLFKDEESLELNQSTPDDFPVVTFVTGNHVDGMEYGSVVVLLERSLPHFWHNFLFESLFIAFTRATTKLVTVVNNSTESPVLGRDIHVHSKENAPTLWRMVDPKFAFQNAYSWIKTDMSNLGERVASILQTRFFMSSLPIILTGINPIIDGLTHIEPPFQPDAYATLSAKHLKWFKLPNENTLAVLKNQGILNHLISSTSPQEFCALLLVICSETEFLKIMLQIDRHRLLYFMHEKQLGFSPIYLITTFDIKRSPMDIHKICEFLAKKGQSIEILNNQIQETSQKSVTKKPSSEQSHEKNTTRVKNQLRSDEIQRTELLSQMPLKEKIADLTKHFDLLSQNYRSQLNVSKIEELSAIRKNLAETAAKLAYCYYHISLEQNGPDKKSLRLAEDFFAKTQEFNPGSIEHFEHYKKCLNLLSKGPNAWKKVEKQENEAKHLLKVGTLEKKIAEAVIRDKIESSPCYNLIKFKSACFLLDKIEKYCHHSVFGAILAAYLAANRKVSLLMNPGVYEEPWSVALGIQQHLPRCLPCEVDIVGNWNPAPGDVNSPRKWITEDPPAVIQNVIQTDSRQNYTFNLWVGHISLTRVFVKNWQPVQTAAVYSNYNSVLHAKQCSFMSKCGAAVSLHKNSQIYLEKCRFVDTYGAVLLSSWENDGSRCCHVENGVSKLHISDSLIHNTKVIGIELRANASALIENCRIQNCSEQAITGRMTGDVTIRNCHLEANSLTKTAAEGAIQMHYCNTTILNTTISNQRGYGIVAEFGKSIVNKVSINNCKTGAILVGSDCSVSNCDFQHCAFGMVIGRTGLLRMSDNKVTRCQAKFHKLPESKAPIDMNTNSEESGSTIQSTNSPSEIKGHASLILEKRAKVREELQRKRTELGDVLGVEKPFQLPCGFCSLEDLCRRSRYILCQRCETTVFCSNTCLENSKTMHKIECDWTIDILEQYKKIMGERNNAATGQQCNKKQTPGQRKGRFRGKKK